MGPNVIANADTIQERIGPFLEPIAGPLPGGTAARNEPAYEAVVREVEKLESLAGGEVDWKRVTEGAGELLRTRTKDLLLASYLAHALHVTGGADGLAAGMALLGELANRYWEALHPEPKRVRGRAGAIQWYVERTAAAVAGSTQRLTAAEVETLEAAARRLSDVSRERLAGATPGFGPLLEALERARLSAPSGAPVPQDAQSETPARGSPAQGSPSGSPAQGGPSQETQGSSSQKTPAVSTLTPGKDSASGAPVSDGAPASDGGPAQDGGSRPGVELDAGEVGSLAVGADATEFLRGVGNALVQAGETLRRADARDPVAYRVLRAGLWIHLDVPPPAAGGRTPVPPPPGALREKLGTLAAHQRWAELVEEAESALPRNRFALELHRLSFQALSGLGAPHGRARDAVAGEVRALLTRMPQLAGLSFSDGSPFADGPTRAWLEEEITPRASAARRADPAPRGGGAADPEAEARQRDARQRLAAGDAAALAVLQGEVLKERDGRGRFLSRLELARACDAAGFSPLALAVYEDLEREASEHRLEEWEPGLVAECLSGLIAAARVCGEDRRADSPRTPEYFRRLCRIDPAAAHEVWPCVSVTK
jgi:type VI secretion system protein VasJ